MQYAYFVTYLVEIQVRAGSEGKDQDSNRKIWLKLILSNSNKSKKIHEFDCKCIARSPRYSRHGKMQPAENGLANSAQ